MRRLPCARWHVHDSVHVLCLMRLRSLLDSLRGLLLYRHGLISLGAFKPLLGLQAQRLLTILSMTVLLSHSQARLDRCCRQRGSDCLLLRGSDVSEVRLVLTSHVLHSGMRDLVLHCLAIKLLIWTLVAAAASSCFCRVPTVALILTCLWVRSFLPRCGFALFCSSSLWCSSKLLRLLAVLVCPSRRARHSHMCSMLTHVLRVVCWTDQSPCTSLSVLR